ncbi:IPT/TIG domain-containing protein [Mesoterricola silvestris]|uniref:IPT/TIG domain-containing protein n=1 Tax=Mesoterricola silvestris TaxID=2927979 RepID=A0AA48GYW0_9BACT|nr:IPT/TIG domain-containing protein [Mesoterricola silvestris]BDU72898.1 hypothetical protein METEAL_20720 [Mesoterricola silvestris]
MAIRRLLLASAAVSLLALGCRGDGDFPSNPSSLATPQPAGAPIITGIEPAEGRSGDAVTLVGTRLEGATRVDFDGVEARGLKEANGALSVLVPAGARTGKVTVHCRAGKAVSGTAFQVLPRVFDAAVDVVPFRLREVKNWPGLRNAGASCFLNTAVKLLASLPEVDAGLLDHAADDAATAGVRRQLRFTVNHIRLGTQRPAGARDPMGALIEAFQHHPGLRRFVAETKGPGGFETTVLEAMLDLLGLKGQFDLVCREKTLVDGKAPAYQDWTFGMVFSGSRAVTGYDFTGIRDLRQYLAHVTSEEGSTGDGARWFRHPVKIPSTSIIKVEHLDPPLALEFSNQVLVPVYTLDEAHHIATINGRVALAASAFSLWRRGHVIAAIKGLEGWYLNDDAQDPRLDPSLGLADGPAQAPSPVGSMGVLFYRRQLLDPETMRAK